jgi:hypothetical protein
MQAANHRPAAAQENGAFAFHGAADNNHNRQPQPLVVAEFGDQYEEISMVARHAQQAAAAAELAAAAQGVATGTVVYDAAGGEAQYVARDDMAGAGAGNANYEVVDDADAGAGGGAAAPRPGVMGNSAVVMGARAVLPSTATSNAIYDGTTAPNSTTTNNTIYEMGPESEQQGQRPTSRAVVVHAPPAYAVPVKKIKSQPDENNTSDMQVPGKKSKPAAAATAARDTEV